MIDRAINAVIATRDLREEAFMLRDESRQLVARFRESSRQFREAADASHATLRRSKDILAKTRTSN